MAEHNDIIGCLQRIEQRLSVIGKVEAALISQENALRSLKQEVEEQGELIKRVAAQLGIQQSNVQTALAELAESMNKSRQEPVSSEVMSDAFASNKVGEKNPAGVAEIERLLHSNNEALMDIKKEINTMDNAARLILLTSVMIQAEDCIKQYESDIANERSKPEAVAVEKKKSEQVGKTKKQQGKRRKNYYRSWEDVLHEG